MRLPCGASSSEFLKAKTASTPRGWASCGTRVSRCTFVRDQRRDVFEQPARATIRSCSPVMDIADGLDMDCSPDRRTRRSVPLRDRQGMCVLAAKPERKCSRGRQVLTGLYENNCSSLIASGCWWTTGDGIHMDAARFPNSAALNEHPPIEALPCRTQGMAGHETPSPDMALPGSLREIRMREALCAHWPRACGLCVMSTAFRCLWRGVPGTQDAFVEDRTGRSA